MGDSNHEKKETEPEYYVERLHNVPNLIDDCCHLINIEWKRSHTARLRSIQGSSENFPMSIILVKKSKKPQIVGHCKISKLFMSHNKVFIETVVIHPSLRGKGLGKVLMQGAEEICKSKNINHIFLATKGQEGFYEKLGYTKCPPISMYGTYLNETNEDKTVKNQIKPVKTTTSENKTNIPAPPPAPPMPIKHTSQNNVPFAKTFMTKNIIY